MVVKRLAVAAVLATTLVVGFVAGYRALQRRKREAFNGGACASIYESASDGFRRVTARPDWLKRCESLRANLGSWRGYQVQLYEIPGKARRGLCAIRR